jgi:hypothetical protein
MSIWNVASISEKFIRVSNHSVGLVLFKLLKNLIKFSLEHFTEPSFVLKIAVLNMNNDDKLCFQLQFLNKSNQPSTMQDVFIRGT